MQNLYQLIILAQRDNNTKAIDEILKQFSPKIKKSLRATALQNREDLEQELKLTLIKIIKTYQLQKVPGFWDIKRQYQFQRNSA